MNPQTPTHIDVMYFPNFTVAGSLPGRLEIKNQRLTLTTVEGTTESPVYKEVFNLSFGEVTRVSSMLDQIKVMTPVKSYRMSVAELAGPVMATGGIPGMAASYGLYKRTGADKWLEQLKNHGVSVSRLGYGKMLGVVFGSALLIVAVIVALAFIAD